MSYPPDPWRRRFHFADPEPDPTLRPAVPDPVPADPSPAPEPEPEPVLSLDPEPVPGTGDVPVMQTFDDLLKQLASDDATLRDDSISIQTATDELAAVSAKLRDAQSKKTADETKRSDDDKLIATEVVNGPRFVGPKDDGTIDVYIGNADGNGYHVLSVKPASAALAGGGSGTDTDTGGGDVIVPPEPGPGTGGDVPIP